LHAPVSSLGERALITRITARLATSPWVVVGPGDDAAVIEPERGMLDVLTTDALVDGVHFDRRFVPADAIGYRALAVNLSDLAAMGASPRAALLSLALPDTLDVTELDQFVDGLLAVATAYRVSVIGGNITRTPGPLMIDVTAIGAVRRRRILTRAGARPGDEVYVTGMLGDAAVGLRSLRASVAAESSKGGADLVGSAEASLTRLAPHPDAPITCEARYLRPDPRVRAGVVVARNRAASSCMDLSDGLADAVRQVAEASGVGMTIDSATLPLSDEARAWCARHDTDPLHIALAGGDDYELLFTVRPSQRHRFRAAQRLCGALPITKIGVVTKGEGVRIATGGTTRELPHGYEHFAAGEVRS
jgi:thiamine-monophosphate kinase